MTHIKAKDHRAAVGDLGAKSHTEGVHGDVLAVWQRNYATNAWGGALPCGHYVPEEAPDETLHWLLRHFGDG